MSKHQCPHVSAAFRVLGGKLCNQNCPRSMAPKLLLKKDKKLARKKPTIGDEIELNNTIGVGGVDIDESAVTTMEKFLDKQCNAWFFSFERVAI